MRKTRIVRISERFCDLCGEEVSYHLGETYPAKCPQCGKDICPRCQGIFKAEVSRFKGCSGTTLPIESLSKTLCLECGSKLEAKLLALGLKLRTSKVSEEE